MGEPMTQLPPIVNPPVVEAVVDIDCEFPPGFELGEVRDAAASAFGDAYPMQRIKRLDEFRLEATEAGTHSRPGKSRIDALQFVSSDQTRLVQVRQHGFSFNQLRQDPGRQRPYPGLDALLPDIERSWNIFRELANPRTVTAVRLRYINRIDLKFIDGQVDIDDHLNIGPRLPEGHDLSLGPFLVQFMVADQTTRCMANVRLAAEQPSPDTLPLILDIEAFSAGDLAVDDWSAILDRIGQLRALKNNIFEGSIKRETRRAYE